MKITNNSNLPQPLVDAVKNDSYSRGDSDYSVTELLSPPRQAALKREHFNEIEEDVTDRIWSLCGQVIHGILERANKTGIAERRLSVIIDGVKVSGGMDLYHDGGKLQDFKFTTGFKFKNGQAPIEFEQQLNAYAHILRENGHKVTNLEIVGIIRDWSKMEAVRDAQYPQSQVIVVQVPLWSADKAKSFLVERVAIHEQAKTELPLCTMEERWAKPDTYAVLKQGASRATRVYESESEAHGHASQKTDLYVSKRPGQNVRCQHYCSVSKFCTQYQALRESLLNTVSQSLSKAESDETTCSKKTG